MTLANLENRGFDIRTRNHARAILCRDFPEPLDELCDVLDGFHVDAGELIRGGGGESAPTQRLRRALARRGWTKRKLDIQKIVDGETISSTTHEIDHFRTSAAGSIALEIEWNNKDPFFDRDLENFQRLHADGAISVGAIVTRGSRLQERIEELVQRAADREAIGGFEDLLRVYGLRPTVPQRSAVERGLEKGEGFLEAWPRVFSRSKFGSATTHWAKLEDRLGRGVGGACPLLLIGIPDSVVRFRRPKT